MLQGEPAKPRLHVGAQGRGVAENEAAARHGLPGADDRDADRLVSLAVADQRKRRHREIRQILRDAGGDQVFAMAVADEE
ncbi:hypothetical protein D3C78_1847940 [compost metagenome]